VLARPEFDIQEIYRKVSYAGDIACFCRAMNVYSNVSLKVKPKREQVARLSEELSAANAVLETKLSRLNQVKGEV